MLVDGGVYDGKRILSRASIRQISANHNEGVPSEEDSNKYTQWSAWGLGWNKAAKKDDSGMLRSAQALDHGGAGGTKILLDADTQMTVALFTVMHNMKDEEQAIFYGPVFNILYSAFE
jgi:CubicO group peptidase (beta-lactamase class C family)